MTTGTELMKQGHEQTEAHADARVIAAVDAIIDEAIVSGEPFSANTIRNRMPSAGPLIGARMRAAAMQKPRRVERVGYEPSTLPSTHSHPVAVWRG